MTPKEWAKADIARLREAVTEAKKAMKEIAKNDEEGEYTLEHRATRAAELAHAWRLKYERIDEPALAVLAAARKGSLGLSPEGDLWIAPQEALHAQKTPAGTQTAEKAKRAS